MKNLIIVFFVLISFNSFSQYDSTRLPQVISSNGNDYLRSLKIRGGLIIPTDTPKIAFRDSGAIAYKQGSTYIWNGRYWSAITSGSTNIYNSNGSLTGNRLLNGNDYNLGFHVDSLDFQAQSGVHLYGGTVFDANFDLINFTSNSTKVSHLTSALIKSDENHYLQNADSLVDYVTPSQLLPITLTGGTDSYSLPAGKLLEKVEIIEPTSITVDIGTSLAGTQIAAGVPVSTGYANFTFNYYASTTTTIYFSNLTGSSVLKLYIK